MQIKETLERYRGEIKSFAEGFYRTKAKTLSFEVIDCETVRAGDWSVIRGMLSIDVNDEEQVSADFQFRQLGEEVADFSISLSS